MQYNPTDAKDRAIPREGQFSFTVTNAEDKYSTTGNEMIALELEISIDGMPMSVFDNLVNTPKSLYNVKQFARSIGRLDEFNNGEFDANVAMGMIGKAQFQFGPEKQNKRGQTVRYLEVAYYLAKEGEKQPTNQEPKPATPIVEPPPVDDAPPLIEPESGDPIPF